MLKGTGSGAVLQFEIFDGGTNSDSSERFELKFTDDVAGWRPIEIPWSSLVKSTDFNPGPNDGLGLTTMWGYAVPAVSGTATVQIDDVELFAGTEVAPTVTLSAASAEVIEGATASINVRLNVAPTTPITVDYATSDGTAGTDDYGSEAGTLTFAAGETTKTISVATTDDAAEEPSETLSLTLSNAVGATLGSPSAATITIVDKRPGRRFAHRPYAAGRGLRGCAAVGHHGNGAGRLVQRRRPEQHRLVRHSPLSRGRARRSRRQRRAVVGIHRDVLWRRREQLHQ